MELLLSPQSSGRVYGLGSGTSARESEWCPARRARGGGCWLGFHAESFGGPFGAHGFWAATAAGIILVSIAISTYAFYIAKDRLKDERVARTCL